MTKAEKKKIRELIHNLSKGYIDWADFITLLKEITK